VETDDSADSHLRAVLESQPVTLVRLAKDGTFLAVNEAGLAALNAERLDQVLGTSFLKLLPEEERPNVSVFIERVISGHRGSIEVDLTGLTGTRHTMQLHASPHPGAPDGIDSVLATVRDITEARRLEQSLVESMARQAELAAAHDAEQARLTAGAERSPPGAVGRSGVVRSARGARKAAAPGDRGAAAGHQAERGRDRRAHRSARGAHAHQRRAVRAARAVRGAREETQVRGDGAGWAGRRRSRPTSTCCGRNTTCSRSRRARATPSARPCGPSSKRRQADAEQAQADVQALKDALNEAMVEQGRLAETVGSHEGAVTEAQARITELERVLSAAQEEAAGKAADLESQLGATRQEMEGLAQSRRLAEAALNARIGSLEAELKVVRQAERDSVTRLNALSEAAQRVAREMTEAVATPSWPRRPASRWARSRAGSRSRSATCWAAASAWPCWWRRRIRPSTPRSSALSTR
jgi:PAS domain S-box-containing protein